MSLWSAASLFRQANSALSGTNLALHAAKQYPCRPPRSSRPASIPATSGPPAIPLDRTSSDENPIDRLLNAPSQVRKRQQFWNEGRHPIE
jgi:hypothetical protein